KWAGGISTRRFYLLGPANVCFEIGLPGVGRLLDHAGTETVAKTPVRRYLDRIEAACMRK
ncbi:hypothetical protein, partial [Mesorhizobium sp. M6A.T.Ce.TU.002.03.1.1]|uniref:hypothetical protein n=1 Tax=Mesorhizobium sp. M6A.T.Ce.TU.002.03.1.1 TaxID=2496782 RepID=UPI0019D183E3